MSDAAAPRRAMDARSLALYAVVVLAWGVSWIALRMQLGVVAPEISVFWRFLIAVAVMFAWALARRLPLSFAAGDHLVFAAMGALMFSFNFNLFYHAGEHIAGGLLAVIFSLASVISLVLGAILSRRAPSLAMLAGGLLGSGGIGLMFWPELQRASLDARLLVGLGMCILGTVSFCVGSILSARLQKRAVPVISATAWGMAYGVAFMGVYALAKGLPFIIEPTLRYLGSLIWVSLVASVIAFSSYLTLVGRIGAARAGYATVMFPVIALMVSTLAEGYVWSLPAAVGLAAVLLGNLMVLRAPPG